MIVQGGESNVSNLKAASMWANLGYYWYIDLEKDGAARVPLIVLNHKFDKPSASKLFPNLHMTQTLMKNNNW